MKRYSFWARYGQPWTPEHGHCHPTQFFTIFLGFAYVFRPQVQFQAAKNVFLGARSPIPRGPNHALDKVLTNETHRRYAKFRSQNVQIFGYVYRNTNGQNHGPVWKTQLFLLSGICMVILPGRTIMGKAI